MSRDPQASVSPPAAPPPPGPAVLLHVRALGKTYDIGPAHRPLRRMVLHDVTLWVSAGECVAIVGGGLAPRTLLRCAAGLAHPTEGAIAWHDARSARVEPPRRALVPHDWCAAAGCLTVGDVLEAATPRLLWQREADAHVRAALDLCALGGALRRRVAALSPAERWLVGLGVAVASGARWLFLEPPVSHAASREAARADRRRAALLGLRAAGHTVIASVVSLRAVPATRALFWRDGRLTRPGADPAAVQPWRVAEPHEAAQQGARPLPGDVRAP